MAPSIPPSSPLSSIPSSNHQQSVPPSQQSSQWRPARKLPFEIQQYVRIYLEEALFTRALDLLLSIVSSDISSQRNRVTVPNPEHLALAATLVVHPQLTTRTTSEEKWAEANAALRLLRMLLKAVGPINAEFAIAFKFRKLFVSQHETDDQEATIKHSFADEDGIFNRADDFWVIVGWAFNCSCLPDTYAARWQHWHLWLEFMIDVLQSDWTYHTSQDSPSESMLWKYINQTPGDTAQPRRALRAIFADGSKSSLNEFREIFRRELKGPKQETDKSQREAVNIDKEVYGDYLAQDSSDSSTDNERRTSKRTGTRALTARRSKQSLHSDFSDDNSTSSPSSSTTTTPHFGPPNAIILRLRLLHLLSQVSTIPTLTNASRQSQPFPDPADLFTYYVEFIKPLPIHTFIQFILPSTLSSPSPLNPDTRTTLLEFLLQRLLDSPPSTISTSQPLTQQRLEAQYLAHAANKASVDTNARVSLCVEGLVRNLVSAGLMRRGEAVEESVERGIQMRAARVMDRKRKGKGKGKATGDEDEAWGVLNDSAARLRSLVRRLKE